MERGLLIGKTSAVGSLYLFLGRAISTIIMAVGTIILGIYILQSDYGLYTIALIPATTFLLFQDLGIGSALTRHCAKCRAANNETDLLKTIKASLIFEFVIGIVLTLTLLFSSSYIASVIFQQPQSQSLIALASITVLSSAIAVVPASVFVAFDRLNLSVIVVLVVALTQSILAPLLVFLGFGALGALIGYTIGIVVDLILSLGLLYFSIIKKLPPSKTSGLNFVSTLKPLLNFGLPYAASTILSGLGLQFLSFMMAHYCDISTIGDYRVAVNFTVLLTFFSVPITTVLLPAFSKIDAVKESDLLKSAFKASAKYASFILVPATFALIVLANPIIGTLYGNKWVEAPFFLGLLVITNLFVLIGNLSITSLLLSFGRTKLLLKTNIIFLLMAIVLGFTIIPTFGMVGVLVVPIISFIPGILILVALIYRNYRVIVDLKNSLRILIASLTALILTYVVELSINSSFLLKLIVGTVLFVSTYVISAPLLGAINRTDIENLKIIFSGIGIKYKIVNIPLSVIEKILYYKTKYLSNRTLVSLSTVNTKKDS